MALAACETWTIVGGRGHHAFTDLVCWRDQLFLAHVTSPYHLGTNRSRVAVRRSSDGGRTWEALAEVRLPGRDIRDPKLAAIGGRLCLYVLANDTFLALPIETLVATSEDGRRWSGFQPVGPPDSLFWRPKRGPDGVWYVPAFPSAGGAVRLLASEDGLTWKEVSIVYDGADASETDIEWRSDGRLVAAVRLESPTGLLRGRPGAATLLCSASAPYGSWTRHMTTATRLDGPALFSVEGRVYAVGRRQVGPTGWLTQPGGLLSRKRTAVYRVDDTNLVHLGDLPSAGDTSYAGVVVGDRDALVVYYTTDPRRDIPWFVGMWLRTEIRAARIPLVDLAPTVVQ